MSRTKLACLFAVCLPLWLAGCRATGTTTFGPTSPALAAVGPTETAMATDVPTATAVELPSPTVVSTLMPVTDNIDPVIILKRSGGFAGLREQWKIYDDGRVEGGITTENPLPAEHIAQILAYAEAGGFFELNDQYIDTNHCCDFFNYEVTIYLPDGRSHTVTTIEQTPSRPPILSQLIQELNLLLFRERIQE